MALHSSGMVDAQNGSPLQLDHRGVEELLVKPYNHSGVVNMERALLGRADRTINLINCKIIKTNITKQRYQITK